MTSPRTARTLTRASARSVLHASADMSVAPLQAIPSLLRELGVEPASVLERVGVDQGALADDSSRVPFGLVGRLIDECAAASACPHFGLLLGIRSGPAAAGIAGHLFRHAESVHAALRLFIAHLHLHDRGGVVALSPQGAEDVELSYVIHHPNTPGTAQILDASIAIACSVMRCLCGAQWTPSEVTVVPRAAANGRTVPLVFSCADQVRCPSLSVGLSGTPSRSARRGRRPGRKSPLVGARGGTRCRSARHRYRTDDPRLDSHGHRNTAFERQGR